MGATRKVRLNNPALLTWARESGGYTIEDIAAHMSKAPEVVLAWEAGEDAPTYRQLEKFARKVKRPVAALYLPEPPPDGSPISGRTRGLPTPETALALRVLRNSIADVREIVDDLGVRLQKVMAGKYASGCPKCKQTPCGREEA